MTPLAEYLVARVVTIHTVLEHTIARMENDSTTDIYKDSIANFRAMADDIKRLATKEFVDNVPV